MKNSLSKREIITDRFHIIQHINRSFNTLRIKEMNQPTQFK
ncbi:transposase [Vagococcus teuberi]